MRAPSATDFHVEVDGVGTFSFARRTMRDEMRIQAELSRLTEGVESPNFTLQTVGGWIAHLKVLTVSAPDGWDLDQMDPLDEDVYGQMFKVFTALRNKEDSFRPKKNVRGEAVGAGDGQDPGVLVPAKVQPSAHGSKVP